MALEQILAGPMTSWTGWDVRRAADRPEAAGAFARSAGGDEVRYELLAVAARGFRPPQFLRTARLAGGGRGAGAGGDQEAEGGGPDPDRFRRTWSLRYRQVAETAPLATAPFAVYLLGVDPPVGATDGELRELDHFYTTVHLPEVAERRHALRAVRYELVEAVQPPYKGAPRYLAAYEVDEQGAANRRHTGPPYSSGPDVWQRHTTPWRLWYRRLPPTTRAGAPGGRTVTPA